ncbi:MAG: DUF4363 family protein [Firmicutes bacterium]|nr:DUF4363 family protein [Bacillota bacterium]
MTRLFIVILLVALLVGLASLEQHVIQSAYHKLENDTNTLVATIRTQSEAMQDIDTPENIAKINEMYEWWLRQERRLSMLARHFDLSQVSINLIYAKNFIYFNNDEEAMVGLMQVQYLVKTHSFNIGTSIQNVI